MVVMRIKLSDICEVHRTVPGTLVSVTVSLLFN